MKAMLRILLILLWCVHDSGSSARAEGEASSVPKMALSPFEIIEETQGLRPTIDFIRSSAGAPLFSDFHAGITETPMWVKARFKNTSREPRDLVIVSEDLKTDYLDAYAFRHNELVFHKETGDMRPYSSRDYDYPGFGFGLRLEAGDEIEFILRFQSNAPLDIELREYSPQDFEQKIMWIKFLQALYVGAMCGIILFNFLLFVSSRERIYLIYCFFQGISVLTLSITVGNGYGVLWPNDPALNGMMVVVLPCLAPAFALIFTSLYLGLKDKSPLAAKAMSLTTAALLGVGVIGLFTGSTPVVKAIYYLLGLTCLLVLGVPTRLAWKGDRFARLFLGAWIPLCLGALVFVLVRLGFDLSLPSMPQGFEMAFGSIWEAVFLSLCLGDKFMQMKKQEISYLMRIRDEEKLANEAHLQAETQKREREISEREAAANRNLIKVICHDLANPLSIILNYAQIMLTIPMELEEKEKALEKIQSAALHQQAIITHVREFEAINSAKAEIKLAPLSIREAVKTVKDLLQMQLEERRIELLVVPFEGDVWVAVDARSFIYNVLTNLTTNAMKFSADGSVISIRVHSEDDWVLIDFEDRGIGMGRDLIDRVFDFNQATSRTGLRGERGTGFGLPLVKSYIERYGGNLSVTSRSREEFPETHGTCFRLKLKKARPNASSEAA